MRDERPHQEVKIQRSARSRIEPVGARSHNAASIRRDGMSQLPPGMPHQSNPSGGLSNDTRALMLYEANKKTALVAYLLWFFLGWFGAHNFYLERTGVAVAQLILTITLVGIVISFF